MSAHHRRWSRSGRAYNQNSKRRRAKLLRIIERDGDRCFNCGVQTVLGTEESPHGRDVASLHHVVEKANGGPDTDENFKLACLACNCGWVLTDVVRVDGRALCPTCSRPYHDHRRDQINVSGLDGEPYLYIACDGRRLKT